MGELWQLMGAAGIASWIMSPIHCLFGLHIVRRGVIFIDLAVAQIAALGMAFALQAGHEPTSSVSYWWALGFALSGAFLIALTRFKLGKVPHEAMIGIFFVLASAASVIVLDKSPHGVEEMRDLLGGSILFVDDATLRSTAWIYGAVLLVLMALWRPTTKSSLHTEDAPKGIAALALDFVFYSLLALVVASSVKIAGVLVVFSWLVMPAVAAFLWVDRMMAAVWLSLPIAIIGSSLGLYLSYRLDWPTGAAIVMAFGATVAVLYVARLFRPSAPTESPGSP